MRLSDTGDSLVLGISAFSGLGLEKENEYLRTNLPVLIKERLSRIPYHILTEEEIIQYRENLKLGAVQIREKEMSTLYNERDRLFFEGSLSADREEEFREKRDELKDEIHYIQNYDLTTIQIEPKKKLSIYTDTDEGRVLEEISFSPEQFCRKHGLDFLIYGSIEQIEDYFFTEIRVWSGIMGKEVLFIEDAASRDDLDDLLERVVPRTFDSVVGAEWAFLTVTADPEEADIYVDGEFGGTGKISQMYILPGQHTITASAPGFLDIEYAAGIVNHEDYSISLSLQQADRETLQITSVPGSADVYKGSTWLGRTPLTIPLPKEDIERLMVVKDDYSPEYYNIGPTSAGGIRVELSPFQFDTSAYLKKKRDMFYLSAGFFVLSFPLPFFLYSMTEDFASGFTIAQQNQNTAEMILKLNQSVNVYHGYIGSLIVTASLLIHTVFRLADYIRASELY